MGTHLQEKIKNLSLSSGVYLMKDASGKVIYVGKAVCLRKRVQSYFRSNRDPKTEQLVANIADIDIIETHSEAEALILEASLIKEYSAKFNIDLKDDKSYPYIEITADVFPKVQIVRPSEKNPDSRYFGPYVGAHLIREALIILRKIFPFCTCAAFPKKACLNYHMGLCPGPCVDRESKSTYKENIENLVMVLEGRKDDLFKKLRREMEASAEHKEFEQAAHYRDQLRALGALYGGTKDINYYKEAEQLQRALSLSHLPLRIEAFDISNVMGQEAVGSMVSFLNGSPDKRNYRRFRIKTVTGIDDFRMMAEVVSRRYKRLKEEGKTYPDLILIDGGKGQLAAAVEVLKCLEINLPIASLAKREEEIYSPKKRDPIILAKDSLGLKLLQRIRDEAHRFAVTYHRLLRTKKAFTS